MADKNTNNRKVLLIGNGIYRAFHGDEESWNNVLNYLCRNLLKGKLSELPECSPILLFEYMHTQMTESEQFETEVAKCLKEMYCQPEFSKYSDEINGLIWSHFDTVVTTNVDNRFEWIESKKKWKLESGGKWKFSTYRRKVVEHDNRDLKIYYIHGEISKPKSICFGLAHYLGEYRNHYENTISKKSIEKIDCENSKKMLSPKDIIEKKAGCEPWSQYLYNNPVDIVGFGLNDSEIDVWWILKLRMLKNCKNLVRYFYPSMDGNAKKILPLLKAFDVEPKVIPCSSYREFYKIYFEDFAGDNRLKKE